MVGLADNQYTAVSYPGLSSFVLVPTNDYVTFHLRACDNVFIRLSHASLYGTTYELEISDDVTTLVDMTSGSPVTGAEEPTPGLLSCYGSKEFWITWHDAAIRVSTLVGVRASVQYSHDVEFLMFNRVYFCIVWKRRAVHGRNPGLQPGE